MTEIFDFDSTHDGVIIGSHKTKMAFDSRFESWTTKILPGRLNAIQQSGGSPEYIERMLNLLYNDRCRLLNRIQNESKDYESYDLRVCALDYIVEKEIVKYQNEIKMVIYND